MPSYSLDNPGNYSASSSSSSSKPSPHIGRLSTGPSEEVSGLAALRAAQTLLDQAQTNRSYDYPHASTGGGGGGSNANSVGQIEGLDFLHSRKRQEDVARILAGVQSTSGGPGSASSPRRDSSSFLDSSSSFGPRSGASYKRPFPYDTDELSSR